MIELALTAIQCRAETGNYPHETPWTAASLRLTRVLVGSGDRAKRCFSEDSALRLIQPCQR